MLNLQILKSKVLFILELISNFFLSELRFTIKIFRLTPGCSRAPLFDEKKRGSVKQNITLKTQ